MKNIIWIFVFSSLLIGCSTAKRPVSNNWSKKDSIKVLATIEMLKDIVQQVGGDRVEAISLIKGNLDPHSYQLVKGDDEKLARADIIFYNGLGLEHGPSLQSYLEKNSKAKNVGSFIHKNFPDQILFFKGQLDPHIWMDMSLWSKTVPYIVESLSEIDPVNAPIYQKNGEKLIESLLSTHEEIRQMLQEIDSEKRYLVTSHDAFNYFARVYLATDDERKTSTWQNRFIAPEGLAPESQISLLDIKFVISHLKKFNISVIFPESNVSKDSLRKIMQASQEMGLKIKIANDTLYADAMGDPGSDGDTYQKMLIHNASVIRNNLKN
ncbi:MAG: ABC transporter substrate-binding protein [Chlamydia sp. 32-24]|nr:MAG: ABC transporter substrate-binding protein [Chlamydia sp. 32-24]